MLHKFLSSLALELVSKYQAAMTGISVCLHASGGLDLHSIFEIL
jgi:hypothetical protein